MKRENTKKFKNEKEIRGEDEKERGSLIYQISKKESM